MGGVKKLFFTAENKTKRPDVDFAKQYGITCGKFAGAKKVHSVSYVTFEGDSG